MSLPAITPYYFPPGNMQMLDSLPQSCLKGCSGCYHFHHLRDLLCLFEHTGPFLVICVLHSPKDFLSQVVHTAIQKILTETVVHAGEFILRIIILAAPRGGENHHLLLS